jgi:murein DD-endopeptidase MepM/ murein hydrolase activator NlpD
MGILQGKGIWTLYDDIQTAVNLAPTVGARYILCKVSKKGKYDPAVASQALAIVHQNPALSPVAWMYNLLNRPADEAECIRRALADGFEAMILDVEIDTLHKFIQAEELVQQVFAMGLDLTRIYLCGDPRLNAKIDDFPYAQLAKICRGGYMPMTYGEIMPGDKKNAASRVIGNAYTEYERHKVELNYSLPLLPILSTYWDNAGKVRMTKTELKKWCDEAQARAPSFVSLYRAAVTLPEAWPPFRDLQLSEAPVIILPETGEQMPLVQPGGAGYQVFAFPPHTPEVGWKLVFTDVQGNAVRVRNTVNKQTMYAQYLPALPKAGRYAIETFIPAHNATSRGAQYFVVYYANGTRQEARVVVNQLSYSDVWVPLGSYDLNPQDAEAGRVNLVDVTADTKVRELAFSAIRWRPVPVGGPGFDAPIGTAEERLSPQIWPGQWVDANPYLTKYSLGYHTGADLNLNFPNHNTDKGKPVYAAADGVVTFAEVVPQSWRGLIVIRHDPLPDGTPVYSRYGHVENISVHVGEAVTRGQQIATVGLFGSVAKQNYHLHFDISCTTRLETSPRDWPGEGENALNTIKAHYVDPKKFIEDHRP